MLRISSLIYAFQSSSMPRIGGYREEKESSVRSDDSDDDGPILYREEEHVEDEGNFLPPVCLAL